MNVELRQLRCLVAVADAGSFTDAAVDLGLSQAAVSRSVASLEAALGARLFRRTTREVTLTATGSRVLAPARRALAAASDVAREAAAGHSVLRVGYAWSALGKHTTPFQRRWAAAHPDTELRMIRANSVTAGLAEGTCDVAVLRTEPDRSRFAETIVGLERRYCAVASDDPWARRRSLRLAELSDRVLAIDRRTGTTSLDLWPPGSRPAGQPTGDIDDWLTAIAAGRCVGVTPESTVAQYPRPGVAYRPLRDAPTVPVRLAWWRDDPHPAVTAAVTLITDLYRGR
ncbi:MAG: LysR family transcriptional regulator [Streptosporangiales bacterium]|jgi:DNA-binding transcriptional LysR family regulator|nr:LysR family transcriptional regulator [Streptosporangiales bacterium]